MPHFLGELHAAIISWLVLRSYPFLIPCVLAPDEAAGAYRIDRSGGARLLVADADASDAAAILRHYAPSGEDDG